MVAIPLQRIEGKYEILEKIREGGMGAIYKVRHRMLDEIRVIKLMRQQFVDDEDLRARFLREARAAIKLRHPNITQIYDFTADEDGVAFIVMEYIRGKTLEDLLKSGGPPPLGLTIEIANQSLRAIGYLHGKGFVHRDISPDNLMLAEDADGNPQIKLIDLGIAKILGGPEVHLTQTGAFLGKVRYASPEQFGSEGAPTADVCGDLYSFGIVLYELLTGAYPISGRDPSSLIAGHLFRPPIPFEETDRAGRVPAGLRAVILKAMEKKPGARHATAQDFARELAPFRVPGDIEPGCWNHLLELVAPAGETARAVAPPGSTQARLDENFELREETPPPPSEPALRAVPAIPVAPAAPVAPVAPDDQPAVRSAARQARELMARHDAGGAAAELRRALGDAPGNRELAGLLAEAESQLARQEREERGRAVAAAVQAVEEALGRGELRAAEAQLYAAEAAFGEQPVFQSLHVQLAVQRREALAAQVLQLVESARRHAAAADLAAALAELQRALHLDPGRGDVAAELAAIEAAIGRQAAERQRQAAVARSAAAIEATLAAGDLVQAGELLDRAHAEHGEDQAFAALSERLRETQQRARAAEIAAAREAQARSLLERAREQAASQDLEQAVESVRQAAAADPDNPDVPELAAELEAAQARQARERRRQEAIARVSAEVQAHLDRGELDDAGKLLDLAVVRLGAAPALRERWERLEELRRQARAGAADLLREARLLFEVQAFEDAARKLGQALRLAPGHAAAQALLDQIRAAHPHPSRAPQRAAAKPAPPEAPKPAPPDAGGPGDLTLPLPVSPTQAGGSASAAAAPAAASASAAALAALPVPAALPAAAPAAVAPPGPVGGRPRRTLPLGAAIALGIAVLLGAAWLLTHRPKSQAAAPSAQEAAAAAAPAPGGPATATAPGAPAAAGAPPPPRGALVVDALPWGEVIAIRDEHGASQPLPRPATTPLVLSLPPGRYTLRLRNPAFTRSVAVEAVVAAGPGAGPARVVAEFRAADADLFLKRMGW